MEMGKVGGNQPMQGPTGGPQDSQGPKEAGKGKEEIIQKLQEMLDKMGVEKGEKGGKAEKGGGAGGAGKEDKAEDKKDKELLELLAKLLKGEIKPEEIQKLAKMLGMKPDDVKQAEGAGTEEDKNKV